MAGKEHRTVMGNATRALAGLAVLALATMARAKWARIVLASSATLGLARSLSAAIVRLRRAAGGRWARRFRPEPDASVITKNASDRRSTREKRTYDAVDEASDQSFPGSDPPAFTATSGSCIRYG